MSYRDDHDAALARADALEAELREARGEHQQDQARIADLEAKLAAARSKPAAVPSPAPPPARDYDEPDPPKPPTTWLGIEKQSWMIASVIGLVVASVAIYELVDHAKVADGWDVEDYLDKAISEARSTWSDAELALFTASYVDSQGKAQLASTGGELRYYFRSDSHRSTQRQPPRPGMPAPPPKDDCLRESIYGGRTGLRESTMSSRSGCDQSLPGKPRCKVVDIWQRAIAKGAPANGVASIKMWTGGGLRHWKFEIAGTQHSYKLEDDCH